MDLVSIVRCRSWFTLAPSKPHPGLSCNHRPVTLHAKACIAPGLPLGLFGGGRWAFRLRLRVRSSHRKPLPSLRSRHALSSLLLLRRLIIMNAASRQGVASIRSLSRVGTACHWLLCLVVVPPRVSRQRTAAYAAA